MISTALVLFMSSSLPRLSRSIAPLLVILAHLVAIIIGGYFLSPEFSVYPFLASRGFLPYVNLLDQHFPALLFGPISLPSFLTTNPQPLLVLFLLITALTDLFFFFSLRRRRVAEPQLWLIIWVVASYWFSGNSLWLETFISFLLAVILFIGQSRRPLVTFASGCLFGLIALTKPTLLPALVFLFLYLELTPGPVFLAGLLSPVFVTGLYLLKLDLLPSFLYLTLSFNRQFYALLAAKAPTLRQFGEMTVFFVPSFILFLKKKQFLSFTIILLSLILVYPRFEFVHLQPALLLTLFCLAPMIVLKKRLLLPAAALVLAFAVAKNYRHRYGNFYLDAETVKLAGYLKTKPEISLYVFGGNDLLYPLSNRIPPGFTYLPSLPWYWRDASLSQKMVTALSDSFTTTVVVRNKAFLDGANIQASAGLIGQFIKDNYRPLETIGSYQIYQRVLK